MKTFVEMFWSTIRAVAVLYALYIQGGVLGIVAVIAVTENFIRVMKRYA